VRRDRMNFGRRENLDFADLGYWILALAVAALLGFALVSLHGCQNLGLQSPRGLGDSIAYGYSTLAAVRNTAATELKADVITVAEAQDVQKQADQVRAVLDAAKTAYTAGDVTTAQGKLAVATSALTALQTYLQNKMKGAGNG